jgi:hypothetical protein
MYLIKVFEGDEVTEYNRASTMHASNLYRKLEAQGKKVQMLRADTHYIIRPSHFKPVMNSWDPKVCL